jgi:hypothetical protein
LLASVFGLGCESHVQACDEVLRRRRVVAGRGETGREFAQSIVSAEVGADSGEAGLLGKVSVDECLQWAVMEGISRGTSGCPAGR